MQKAFGGIQTRRPMDEILAEVASLKRSRGLLFFVDDNITSNLAEAKAFFRALIPLKVRWVGQASINAAHDEEFLDLLVRSGCQGVLIGFESLNPANLAVMNKRFNLMGGGYAKALENLRRFQIRLYATFIFGYDADTPSCFDETLEFAMQHNFYITAFNHLTPFPGTDLYKRLESEGRLLFPAWWLDHRYTYNMIPFRPGGMTPDDLERGCVEARRRFYSWSSILRRSIDPVNRANLFMFRNYFLINAMHRADVDGRNHYPLGDEGWRDSLLHAG